MSYLIPTVIDPEPKFDYKFATGQEKATIIF